MNGSTHKYELPHSTHRVTQAQTLLHGRGRSDRLDTPRHAGTDTLDLLDHAVERIPSTSPSVRIPQLFTANEATD